MGTGQAFSLNWHAMHPSGFNITVVAKWAQGRGSCRPAPP